MFKIKQARCLTVLYAMYIRHLQHSTVLYGPSPIGDRTDTPVSTGRSQDINMMGSGACDQSDYDSFKVDSSFFCGGEADHIEVLMFLMGDITHRSPRRSSRFLKLVQICCTFVHRKYQNT